LSGLAPQRFGVLVPQVAKELPVLRAEGRFDLEGKSLRQSPQCVGSRHHRLAEVRNLRGKLREIHPAADLLRQPALPLLTIRIDRASVPSLTLGAFRRGVFRRRLEKATHHVRLQTGGFMNLPLTL